MNLNEEVAEGVASDPHDFTERPPKPNGNTISRASSAASIGRPYQTNTDEPKNQRRQSRSAPDKEKKSKSNKKKLLPNGRQWSADSGIETGSRNLSATSGLQTETGDIDTNFILPPRITTYAESECYLMNLPRCDQFATHLARN